MTDLDISLFLFIHSTFIDINCKKSVQLKLIVPFFKKKKMELIEPIFMYGKRKAFYIVNGKIDTKILGFEKIKL